MAPEIVGEYRHSLSVDMWSLGCITFVVLSGRFPFSAEDDAVRDPSFPSCCPPRRRLRLALPLVPSPRVPFLVVSIAELLM
jgi:serine/threonine protein kinase